MTDRLQFSVHSEVEQTIDSGAGRDTSRVVVRRSECSEHLTLDIFYLSRLYIIFLLSVSEEPVHSVTYSWSNVDILHKGEVRKTDLEIVVHTVLELIPKSRLIEFRCLEVDSVLQRCTISERKLLEPLFFSDSMLELEWIES